MFSSVIFAALMSTVVNGLQHDFSSGQQGQLQDSDFHSKFSNPTILGSSTVPSAPWMAGPMSDSVAAEELMKEINQVHPFYDPQSHERPLITTCCDFKGNPIHDPEQVTEEAMQIQYKCFREMIDVFIMSPRNGGGVGSIHPPTFVMDRNVTVCLFQCLSREMNVSDAAGNILVDRGINVTLVASRKKLGLTEEMVTQCVNRANKVGPEESLKNEFKCNMATVEFEQCILERIDILCPDENKLKAELCDRYRDKLKRRYLK